MMFVLEVGHRYAGIVPHCTMKGREAVHAYHGRCGWGMVPTKALSTEFSCLLGSAAASVGTSAGFDKDRRKR